MRPKTRDRLENALLMVLDNHQEIIPSEAIDAFSEEEAQAVILWAGVMMFEASDNPVRARHAPKCLRRVLPADHYLQAWRMPKRKAVHG